METVSVQHFNELHGSVSEIFVKFDDYGRVISKTDVKYLPRLQTILEIFISLFLVLK